MSEQPLLEARAIVKSFGRVQALTGANFSAFAGEVVALVGDNGAGKSTLVKALVGVHPPDSGEIIFEGRPVTIHTPQQARDIGIETVYQDLALAAEIDPAANMFLGREILRAGPLGKLGFLDKPAMRKRSEEAFRNLGVRIQDTTAPVANMSGGQRQGIAISRAVTWASKIVFMDEPTAALGVVQTRNVLEQIKKVREQGLAVVLISHNLPEIFEVADRIEVLRLGERVARLRPTEVSMEDVVSAKAALQKDADLKGIFGTNLFSAEGAATGVREAGADVKIVGFDAGPKQVKDLEDGTVQALIAQRPADIGSQGVEQAFNALEGKPTTKKIGTESVSITKDNLSENQDNLYKPSC